jgi:hypothetical protein
MKILDPLVVIMRLLLEVELPLLGLLAPGIISLSPKSHRLLMVATMAMILMVVVDMVSRDMDMVVDTIMTRTDTANNSNRTITTTLTMHSTLEAVEDTRAMLLLLLLGGTDTGTTSRAITPVAIRVPEPLTKSLTTHTHPPHHPSHQQESLELPEEEVDTILHPHPWSQARCRLQRLVPPT